MTDEYCDGCRFLTQEPPVRADAVYTAHCTDPDKAAWVGKNATVSARRVCPPWNIHRPAWCRRKKESAVGRATNTPDGKI